MIASSPQHKATRDTKGGGKALLHNKQKVERTQSNVMDKLKDAVASKKTAATKENLVAQATKYLKGVWAEAKRVTWPSPADVKRGTVVVIVTVALISLYLFIIDKGLEFIFKFLRNLLH